MPTPQKKDHSLRNQIVLSLFSAIVGGLISWSIVVATRHEQTTTELQRAQADAARAVGVQLESRLQRLETTVEDAHRRIDGIQLLPPPVRQMVSYTASTRKLLRRTSTMLWSAFRMVPA